MNIYDEISNLISLEQPFISILSIIEREMERQSMSLHELSLQSGINRGLLSAVFTRIPPKPMSVQQLDAIGKTLGQPEGWLYEVYAEGCFSSGKTHWKQIKNFLVRCVQLEKTELIQTILSRATEEAAHIQDVFLLAEALFAEGKWKASIPFYRCVCESEIKQHSERLAISHYKWFRARLDCDLKENHKAAVQFTPYRQRLPDHLQLDALLQLANVHFSLHQWKEVIQFADEMQALMLIILHQKKERERRKVADTDRFETERHLVFYYGQSFLLKGNALEWMGHYEEALQFIAGYEDLSWFDDLGHVGSKEVEKFSFFARANRHNLNVLMGQFECLPDYMAFLDEHPEEWLPSMLTIMNAANSYGYAADDVLTRFSKQLEHLLTSDYGDSHAYYQAVFQRDRCARLCYQLALYHLRHDRHEKGLEWLLKALSLAMTCNNKNLIINCAAYFEQYRRQAAAEQKQSYEYLMKGAIEDAQMDVYSSSGKLS